jgi:hypothetical protein
MKIITTLLVTAALSLFSLGANASWTCKVSNHKHEVWRGVGTTHRVALKSAMETCAKNSRDCVVKACHQK